MNKEKMDDNQAAIPCGLIAKSVFNDTYDLTGPNNKKIYINENNIAWDSDLKDKYANTI